MVHMKTEWTVTKHNDSANNVYDSFTSFFETRIFPKVTMNAMNHRTMSFVPQHTLKPGFLANTTIVNKQIKPRAGSKLS
jgi:hypothetical protein